MRPERERSEEVSAERALEVARQIPAPFVQKIGLEWLEVGPGRVVARIPVEGNTQPYGQLHGGATASLCETIGSIGAAFVAGMDKLVVGTTLTVNHLRAVREGFVTGTGVP
jgi:1,4-dihydroxy-2-naphthoyl-CoA hydrolase